MYKNKPIAEAMTVSVFGYNGLNDCADAFRHSFFNAINSRDTYSAIADAFGKAHECGVPDNKLKEKTMDLHNNSIGNAIGSANRSSSDQELALLVLEALERGDMKVLNNLGVNNFLTSSSQLVTSDSCF